MPPRPAIKARQPRPASQIFLGKAASPNLQDLTQSPYFASAYPSLIDGTPPVVLPDLPEPPSPISSIGSDKSGLPSPPATNSTGSGSTGDPATIRERPLSLHSNSSASTSSSSHHTAATPMNRSINGGNSRSSSRSGHVRMDDTGVEGDFDDDYDKENDNDNESNQDEDDTARFDRKSLANSNHNNNQKSSNENALALQRVRSLAQRNRLALDKLSRLGSPSPGRSNTPNSRSPAPSHVSNNSSRLSQPPRQLRALPDVPRESHDLGRSGSETERESVSNYESIHSRTSHSSSSHSQPYSTSSSSRLQSSTISSHRSSTPPPSHSSPYGRLRHLSAPTSPEKARAVAGGSTSASSGSRSNSNSNSSHSPSRRRRHRTSMASMSQLQLTDFEEEDGDEPDLKTATGTRNVTRDRTLNERDLITQSALAAVASSRRSPMDNRRRGALPREFRSDLAAASSSPANGGRSTASGSYEAKDSMERDERRGGWKDSVEPVTPSRPSAFGRSATLRDTRRTSALSPRWSMDDFREPVTMRDRQYGQAAVSNEDLHAQREGRRQSLRGGSAESALGVWSPGGRLLGEGLRAAGLSPRGKVSDAGPSSETRDGVREDRKVGWRTQDAEDRRRVFNVDRPHTRAATSMAHYQYLDRDKPEEDRDRRPEAGQNLRTHRSTFSLIPPRDQDEMLTGRSARRDRDSLPPERIGSSLNHYSNTAHTSSPIPSTPAHLLDRHTTGSPFGTKRHTQPSASMAGSQAQSEHTRLLVESLAMFETQLAKLPPTLGSSTSSSTGAGHFQTELARNAQGVVLSAERLAELLKHSGSRAREAQIEAEVDSASREHSNELVDVWGRVAADYRDSGRTADELVRGLTSMLLGFGRIMRDLGGSAASELGSPSVHGRNASLGDDDFGISPDQARGSSGTSGRHSVASRSSWDAPPRDRERDREDALRRLDGGTRPESVLARASPATFQKLKDREREREQAETPPPASRGSTRKPATGSGERPGVSGTFRRLFTPREQREQILDERAARDSGGARSGMTTLDSQETIHVPRFEPSPSLGSKARTTITSPTERIRTLTPLSIPKPLAVLPSESMIHRPLTTSTDLKNSPEKQNSLRTSTRRPSTTRGDRPSFPSIMSPSNATTALTPHTVSNTPINQTNRAAFPLVRTESGKSTRSQVTFSRPNAVSVSATLSDLQQQHLDSERNRTISTTSSNAEPSTSVLPDSSMRPISGSETERDKRRTTLGVKAARAPLDNLVDERSTMTANVNRRATATVHAADRSAATTILQQSEGARRERRRTVTDIWPRE